MRNGLLLPLLAAVIAVPASAQLPGLRLRQPPPPLPVQNPIEALRGDFAVQSGGTTVYFAPGSAQLSPAATTILANQANWLRQHPEVAVRVEGHGDPTDSRDHALALGARRAEEARDYLILLGIPAAQVTAMTWGKERPGPPSAVTTISSGGPPLIPAAG
jgi:peptidoglycan-associated lipoprotein